MNTNSSSNAMQQSSKAAHVNMMTDTIIASLPPEALRSITRGLLGVDAKVTPAFHDLALKYLQASAPVQTPLLFSLGLVGPIEVTPQFHEFRSRYRCLMGCGRGFETAKALIDVIEQISSLVWSSWAVPAWGTNLYEAYANTLTDIIDRIGPKVWNWSRWADGRSLREAVANIDGDIVQAVTSIQKELSSPGGLRALSNDEIDLLSKLQGIISVCESQAKVRGLDVEFQRGRSRVELLLWKGSAFSKQTLTPPFVSASSSDLEMFKLGHSLVPRVFMGLWQFSSPAWGSASRSQINDDFRKHVDAGFYAFDMADHYADAEVTFVSSDTTNSEARPAEIQQGQFRSSQADANHIFCATKWCVFEPVTVSEELVESSITERLRQLHAQSIDLLQFHWQDYNDAQYVKAAKMIEADPRVTTLGLCNFDTRHMDEIVDSGVPIASNQVQFSLIDLRPEFRMSESCRKNQVKLLTYGSLCGGFLAEKWLGKPAPNPFENEMTPSHRKYLEMIMAWGGWELFQQLLAVLAVIGMKHDVSLSLVAIRWVLDHDYVGAVIIGARMGISEHIEENRKVFSFKLDSDDQSKIQSILQKCRAWEMFEAMGDCGSEYRQ